MGSKLKALRRSVPKATETATSEAAANEGEPCNACRRPAATYVSIETMIDEDEAEEDSFYLCEEHTEQAREIIGSCELAASHKPDEYVPDGCAEIRLSPHYDDDEHDDAEIDEESWVCCAGHAGDLEALARRTEPRRDPAP